MLISIRRIATAIVSIPRFPPDRSQPRRALPLLPRSTLATGGKPKSVLETFKDHGFTDEHIEIIARKAPQVVAYRSGDLVGAKMRYLCRELGLDRSQLVEAVTTCPDFLQRSLANAIIPSIDRLASLLGSRRRAIPLIVRAPWLLWHGHGKVAANVGILKDSGVPEATITKMMLARERALIYHKPERFRSLVDSVLSAGFDPSTPVFVHAIRVRSAMSSSTRARKVGVYTSFGWSAEEIELAFRRFPTLFMFSEDLLRQKLHFLMNVLGLRPVEVLAQVALMTLSLEGTLIPRCCVLNVLMGRGLVKKDLNLPVSLSKTKEKFAGLYVEKYRDVAPEVLDAYEGKMRFSGFDS